MNRRITSALAAAGLAALGLAFSTPAMASPATVPVTLKPGAEGAVKPHTCYPVSPRFVDRWNKDSGAYGCAITSEVTDRNSTFQYFERGEIVWSPSQGSNMILSGFVYHNAWNAAGIHIEWGDSLPFNYDNWLIRSYVGSNYTGQRDCSDIYTHCTVWAGVNNNKYIAGTSDWPNAPTGTVNSFEVEGCDNGDNCNQSWTYELNLPTT